MTYHNLVLCGFMGCGKTTVGRLLAQKAGLSFLDMDDYIEQQAGQRVPALFAQRGEAAFRELEHAACVALARREGAVIAAGGGALTFPRNVDALRGKSLIVLLDVPEQTLLARLRRDTGGRPLLAQKSDAEIAALLHSRMPAYREAADLTVPAGGTPAQAAQEILSRFTVRGQKIIWEAGGTF